MKVSIARTAKAALCLLSTVAILIGTRVAAQSPTVPNLTGLPLYPRLSRAAMDPFSKTDTLGHWCSRFAAESVYSLDAVESWYRITFRGASETDLIRDDAYRHYASLAGIKLALGVDYVAVFRAANQLSTSIELVKCSAPTT